MTTLTESTIRSLASEQSFERGREYYHSGAIYNTIRQGNTLLADCVGTDTYHLRIELDEAGIQSASCTCPYELGGYCKHLVALLLTYIHKPDEFTERKSLSVLLENVDKTTLVTILTKLTDRNPELYTWLETIRCRSAPVPCAQLPRPMLESLDKCRPNLFLRLMKYPNLTLSPSAAWWNLCCSRATSPLAGFKSVIAPNLARRAISRCSATAQKGTRPKWRLPTG
jgi:hypothetical protein